MCGWLRVCCVLYGLWDRVNFSRGTNSSVTTRKSTRGNWIIRAARVCTIADKYPGQIGPGLGRTTNVDWVTNEAQNKHSRNANAFKIQQTEEVQD